MQQCTLPAMLPQAAAVPLRPQPQSFLQTCTTLFKPSPMIMTHSGQTLHLVRVPTLCHPYPPFQLDPLRARGGLRREVHRSMASQSSTWAARRVLSLNLPYPYPYPYPQPPPRKLQPKVMLKSAASASQGGKMHLQLSLNQSAS